MLLNENDMSFICFNCGPYPDLWIEKWSLSKKNIVKVAVAQHKKGIARIIHIIKIIPVENDADCGDYPFCWSCHNLIPMPLPSSMMLNYLSKLENEDIGICEEE